MTALLAEGFADTYRGIGAALRLFWPVAATYLVMIVAAGVLGFFAALESEARVLSFFLVALAVTIYAFFALCQGAVGWHRRILLNEAARWISPIPSSRGLRYALAVFIFIVIFLIGHLAISSVTLPYLHSVFTSALRGMDLTNAPVEQLELWRRAVWPIQIATLATAIILVSAILWFGRTWLLVFPYISIRSTEPTFSAIRESLNHPAGLVGALLIVFFLPFLLGTIYYVATPMSVQLFPAVRWPMTIFNIALSIFCFLWGLSILSLAYRQAAVDKIARATGAAMVNG